MEQRVAVTTSYPYEGVQFEVAFSGPELVVRTLRAGYDGRPQLAEVRAYTGPDGAFHPYVFERESLGPQETVVALDGAEWKSCG